MDSFGLHIVTQDSVDELDEDRRLASIAAAISFSRSSALAATAGVLKGQSGWSRNSDVAVASVKLMYPRHPFPSTGCDHASRLVVITRALPTFLMRMSAVVITRAPPTFLMRMAAVLRVGVLLST